MAFGVSSGKSTNNNIVQFVFLATRVSSQSDSGQIFASSKAMPSLGEIDTHSGRML